MSIANIRNAIEIILQEVLSEDLTSEELKSITPILQTTLSQVQLQTKEKLRIEGKHERKKARKHKE